MTSKLTRKDYNEIHEKDDMYEYDKGIYYIRNRMIEAFFYELRPQVDPILVIEVGCSYGFLANMIQEHRLNSLYFATNFSPELISKTKKYFASERIDAWTKVLDCKEVKNWLIDRNKYKKDTLYISCSLEHFEDDLKFIDDMALGSYGIFSVPNFDSKGHYRYFKDFDEIESRYNHLLEFKNKGSVSVYSENEKEITKFIFVGVRRDL